MIGADKFKDNPVSLVDPETPDFMVLGTQFFGVKRRVEWIVFEQVRFGDGFSLDGGRQFLEESIECSGGRDLDHRGRLLDQVAQRLPFGYPSCTMVPLRRFQGVQKFLPIETDGIAKGFEIRFGDLDLDAFFCFLGDFGFKSLCHARPPVDYQTTTPNSLYQERAWNIGLISAP